LIIASLPEENNGSNEKHGSGETASKSPPEEEADEGTFGMKMESINKKSAKMKNQRIDEVSLLKLKFSCAIIGADQELFREASLEVEYK
jgi:hypothetical protein